MTPGEALEELAQLDALLAAIEAAPDEDVDTGGVRRVLNGAVACTAKSKRTGKPCRQAAIRYTNRCRMHCGMTPAEARAQRDSRIALAALLAIEDGDLPRADELIAMLPAVNADDIIAAMEHEEQDLGVDVDALLGEPPEDLARLLEVAEEFTFVV